MLGMTLRCEIVGEVGKLNQRKEPIIHVLWHNQIRHEMLITSLSNLKDSAGRFVAGSLRKAGRFCMMHTVPIPMVPAPACESIVADIDLETNSLDVLSSKILEIGALIFCSHIQARGD